MTGSYTNGTKKLDLIGIVERLWNSCEYRGGGWKKNVNW